MKIAEKTKLLRALEKLYKTCLNRGLPTIGQKILNIFEEEGLAKTDIELVILSVGSVPLYSKGAPPIKPKKKKSAKSNGLIFIQSQFLGTCFICSQAYRKGEQIFCEPDAKTGWHALCGSEEDKKKCQFYWTKWMASIQNTAAGLSETDISLTDNSSVSDYDDDTEEYDLKPNKWK